MKYLLTSLLTFVLFTKCFSQENTVNIIAFGDGKSKDEATNAALRHCIEKTFGVFVTTNSQVVNDQLVKDEIATIASGNIVSYDVISNLQKGDIYTITVSAIVSPDNIVKTYKSKGYSFEINGNVYAQNIQKERYYKEQEPKIIEEFLSKYADYPIFDTFAIKIGEPFLKVGYYEIGLLMNGKLKNMFDILIPNHLFLKKDDDQSKHNYGQKWGGFNETNIKASFHYSGKLFRKENHNHFQENRYYGESWKNPESNSYIIPIAYSPHYNEENASALSDIFTLFFDKLSIKNPDYDSKFGETYNSSICILKSMISKKGKLQGYALSKLTYKFRNNKTINLIKEFSEFLSQKANPNSIEILNLKFKLKEESGWYFQPFQNFVDPLDEPRNVFDKFGRQFFDLNLVDGVGSSFDGRGPSGPFTYNFRTCLILLNLTESELSKVKKLEFKWK